VKFPIEHIYVDERSRGHSITRRVLDRAEGIPVSYIGADQLDKLYRGMSLDTGKRTLVLTVQKGDMVKPCPGTSKPYLCCKYTVLNSANHCPMDCTYCVLQGYLERPCLTVFTNTDTLFKTIDRVLSMEPRRFFRIGTGEFADSLALDYLTGFSADLAGYFSSRENCVIELKTKADCIENILTSPPDRVVAAWSVNPVQIVSQEEHLSASLGKRMKAARKCQDHGCMLAFHFDPLILYEGWERGYAETVETIFSNVDSTRIAWISLGALRFPPDFRRGIIRRFPETSIVYNEMIRGIDGKIRYIRPARVKLFRYVFQRIRSFSKDVFVYFCMEPPWVWDSVMGCHPETNEELDYWFARSMNHRFPGVVCEKPDISSYTAEDFSASRTM